MSDLSCSLQYFFPFYFEKYSIYVYNTFYLSIHPWWTFELFPPCSYCDECYYEHSCPSISLNSVFQIGGIYIGVESLDQRYCRSMFHNGCTILHSHEQYMRVTIPPYSHQQLFSIFFFFITAQCMCSGTSNRFFIHGIMSSKKRGKFFLPF